jgi:hypothetical protein
VRLHRIRLANYRGVSACDIHLPDAGIVVIEGDNEVGKSSLAEALGLILDYHDDSESSAVRAVRPVHRDVSPEVELEVASGPYRFQYLKRFGRDRKTELRILAPAPEQLTGREAHQRVLRILEDTTDVALWRALRIQQGAELRQADLANHPSLAAALDQAAGAALGGDREHSLFDRVRAEFDRYFTPTGQDGKTLKNVRDEAAKASSELDRVERSLAELEAKAEEHADLERTIAELHPRLVEADVATLGLHESWNGLERHRAAAELLRQAARGAELARVAAVETVARREVEVAAAEAKRRLVAALPEDADASGIAEAEAALAAASAALAKAAELLDTARHGLRLAEGDAQYREDIEWAAQMTERHDRTRENQQRLKDLSEFITGCRVTPEALKSLEQAEKESLTLRGRLEAEQVTLEIEVARPTDLEVNGAASRVSAGAPLHIHITGETRISVPGVLSARVVAGSSVQEITEKLAAVEQRVARLCATVGVGSLEEARASDRDRQMADRDRTAIRQQMANDLRDLTPDTLADKLARTRSAIASYEAERDRAASLPPTLDEAKRARDTAGVAVTVATQRHVRADEAHRHAVVARDEAVAARQRSAERAAAAREALAAAESDLALARQAASDEELPRRQAAAEVEASAAAGNYREAAAALATVDADVLKNQLDAANQDVRALAADLRHNEDALRDARQFLNIHGESGLHEARDRARSRLDRATRERDAMESQAAAARLLHDTMLRARTEARRNYAGPFRGKVEALGRLVFGPTFEVELDDELRIARRTLDGVTVDFAQLSAGAREQLSVIARIACAALVSSTGGVPLVLDDILSWSDPGRLESISEALVIGSRDCQVILLTCTPERFAAVRPATVIHLPDGRVTHREPGNAEATLVASPPPPIRKPVPLRLPAAQLQGAFDLLAEPARQDQEQPPPPSPVAIGRGPE